MKNTSFLLIIVPILGILCSCGTKSVIAPGAKVQIVAGDLKFTEGPVDDGQGNLYFSDIPANRIYKYSSDGQLSVFLENSDGCNGNDIDKQGNILSCATRIHSLVSINQAGERTILADSIGGKPFNELNDLWIDPKSGVYFTDPYYGRKSDSLPQGGQHVFYLSPDRKTIIRVIENLKQPNGLVGTPDCKLLYVGDYAGNETHVYNINDDGTVTHKALFAPLGSDGMTLDSKGNLYITNKAVVVYNPEGKLLQKIEFPEEPANVCFGGKDKTTLFVTARTSVYSLKMNVNGY